MKQLIKVIAVLTMCIFIAIPAVSQDVNKKQIVKVNVYGREACGLCKNFTRQLNKEKIIYTYFNIDDPRYRNQLMRKIRRAHPNARRIMLPIIELQDEILISPRFGNFMKKYNDYNKKNNGK